MSSAEEIRDTQRATWARLSRPRQLVILRHLREHFAKAASPTARALAELGLIQIESDQL